MFRVYSKHRKITEKLSLKKLNTATVPVDTPISVQIQKHHIKECRVEVEKLRNVTHTSQISFLVPTCPAKKLKESERDSNTALLSFAINSGLSRFSDPEHLHSIFELIKDPEYDSSVVPEEFKNLLSTFRHMSIKVF